MMEMQFSSLHFEYNNNFGYTLFEGVLVTMELYY